MTNTDLAHIIEQMQAAWANGESVGEDGDEWQYICEGCQR